MITESFLSSLHEVSVALLAFLLDGTLLGDGVSVRHHLVTSDETVGQSTDLSRPPFFILCLFDAHDGIDVHAITHDTHAVSLGPLDLAEFALILMAFTQRLQRLVDEGVASNSLA